MTILARPAGDSRNESRVQDSHNDEQTTSASPLNSDMSESPSDRHAAQRWELRGVGTVSDICNRLRDTIGYLQNLAGIPRNERVILQMRILGQIRPSSAEALILGSGALECSASSLEHVFDVLESAFQEYRASRQYNFSPNGQTACNFDRAARGYNQAARTFFWEALSLNGLSREDQVVLDILKAAREYGQAVREYGQAVRAYSEAVREYEWHSSDSSHFISQFYSAAQDHHRAIRHFNMTARDFEEVAYHHQSGSN